MTAAWRWLVELCTAERRYLEARDRAERLLATLDHNPEGEPR